MKAFIGRSFNEEDEPVVRTIIDLIESHGDINCSSAKPAQAKPVDEKVTELIRASDLFVAIFTRDRSIVPKEQDSFFGRIFLSKRRTYTTSAWVLQESGYALGCGIPLVIFVENGVDSIPQLQGNLEYIPFDRTRIQDTSITLNQMLVDIKSSLTGGGTAQAPAERSPETESSDDRLESRDKTLVTENGRAQLNDVFNQLSDGHYVEAKRLFYDEVEPQLPDDEKLVFAAIVLRFSHQAGDESALGELEQLTHEHPGNAEVAQQFGYRYRDMREFERARQVLLRAKDRYDASNPEQRKKAVECCIDAAKCDVLSGEYSRGIQLLRELLADGEFEDKKADIVAGMAYMAKDEDCKEDFICYAEVALDIEPLNNDLRFYLAYVYADGYSQELALFHYKKLLAIKKNTVALNNLGVCYKSLKLKCKSVSSYRQSAESDETLAMANLAEAYLDAGFLKEARKLITEALQLSAKGIEVHENVGRASRKLKNLKEEEEKTEKKLLANAKGERAFRLQYARSFLCEGCAMGPALRGVWQTPWGKVEIDVADAEATFEGKGHDRHEVVDWASFLVPQYPPARPGKRYEDRYICIEGKVMGMTGRYTIGVDNTERTSLLSQPKIHSAVGYMILTEGSDSIRIMERTTEGKTEFIEWKKISADMAQQNGSN